MKRSTRKSTFYLWGKRTYVQGSHVTEEFLLSLEEWGFLAVEDIAITFFSPVQTQGEFVLYEDKESLHSDRDDLCAMLQGTVAGKRVFVGLITNDDTSVSKVVPDDEAHLLASAVVDEEDKSVSIPYPGRERLFNYLVAMNKHLLKTVLPQKGYAPWILGRIYLHFNKIGRRNAKVSVHLVNNVGNLMTRSKVHLDDSIEGEIQFTRSKV